MLTQEQEESHKKHFESIRRTKSKFNISKPVKVKQMKAAVQGQVGFNDPLYENLDNEVANKQQHNFGPWIEHDILKSRQKDNILKNSQTQIPELPVIYRPQDTTSRYYQDQESWNFQRGIVPSPSLGNIREKSQRAFSLQNLRAASLEFNLGDNIPLKSKKESNGTIKTPFFLKMHGYPFPKGEDQYENFKKCSFIFNYCFQQPSQSYKNLPNIRKVISKQTQNYFKMSSDKNHFQSGQKLNNQILLKQLKQHRLNKLK